MATSQNGWFASPSREAVHLVKLAVRGVEFIPGVRAGDVHTVFQWLVEQLDRRVERAVNPGCWGYNFRGNRNGSGLSNHSSATAIDYNAPEHPNGVRTARTFSQREIDEIHAILRELDGVIRWGGDYKGTPDSMHFEINASAERVAAVARKIERWRAGKPQGAPKPPVKVTGPKPVGKRPVYDISNIIGQALSPKPRALPGVKATQARLNAVLGLKLVCDGVWGPKTEAAYAAWQRKLGYSGKDANGKPGTVSLRALHRGHNDLVV